ncbi:unnamed protein product [Brassica oleracea var. botrytis]
MTLIFAMCQFLSASGAVVVGDELPGYTVIGGNNIIGHHAVVGVKCQHLKYKVYHGDDCFFSVRFTGHQRLVKRLLVLFVLLVTTI